MPITLYPTTFKYKKNNGQYQSVNAIKGDPGEVTQAELDNALAEHEESAEETYAKKDGYYSEMSVGNAEQLVSSKFVEDQEPYTLRPAGGSADIGNRENLTAIVGGTLAWNQQVRDEASDNVTEFADIVTVDDAVADNAGVKVKLEPVQDLHGYDSPWPAGGGKNLAPINSWSGHSGNVQGMALSIPANTQFTYSLIGTVDSGSNQFSIIFVYSDNTESGWASFWPSNQRQSKTATPPKDVVGVKYYSNSEGWSASNNVTLTIEDFQIELGSTATDFAPYSNICPISGFDSVKVTRTVINIWDEEWEAGSISPSGQDESGGGRIRSKNYISVVPDAVYYFKGVAPQWVHICYYDADKNFISDINPYFNGTVTIPSGAVYCRFNTSGLYGTTYNNDISINYPATDTEYHAYQGQTYSITLPSEAGTVYGGELTVNEDGTGQVVVDRAQIVFDGTQEVGNVNWRPLADSVGWLYLISATPGIILTSADSETPKVVSDRLKTMTYNTIFSGDENGISVVPGGATWGIVIRVTDTSLTTEAAINAWLSENHVQVVYGITAPITYTLSASQVQTILGTNNVWADAGQLSLTYKGTNEYLNLTDGRKYLTRINGVDSMVLGAGQALTAIKGRDNVFDLTQMFGTAAVADYVYGQGAGYFRKWFPNSLYAYNPGELKSVEGLQSHDTVGFNLWDEEYEMGYWDTTTGQKMPSSSGWARSKNYIPVFPNTAYCFTATRPSSGAFGAVICFDAEYQFLSVLSAVGSVFNTPSDAAYVAFYAMHSWFEKPICISLVNSGTRNGEYEPYEKHSYPLDPSVVLRGIPKLIDGKPGWDGDRYLPDGTVERRYGVVDLGTLTWVIKTSETKPLFTSYNLPNGVATTGGIGKGNAVCKKYLTVENGKAGLNGYDKTMAYGAYYAAGANLYIQDSDYTDAASFKAAMSGVLLVYELATPTSETAEPYKELQQVDDWGTEEFVATGLIPVGHVTQYPANLRDKLQHLPDLASSNGIYIVKQTDSEMELMRLPDMPAENGNYRLKLNVASGSPTFSWEVVT